MKITKNTLSILSNFANINNNMQFYEGNVQKTFHVSETILAIAKLDIEIPRDFGIWDLKQFLGILSLFNEPELEFDDRHVIIKEDKQLAKYRVVDFKALNMKVLPKNKDYVLPDIMESFSLSVETLNKIRKMASLFDQKFIGIEAKDGKLNIKTFDGESIEKYTSLVEIGDSKGDFNLILSLEKMDIISTNYLVELSRTKRVCFKADNQELTYFMPCEKSSIVN